MFLLSSVLFVVLLQPATGDPYCSLNDIHIDCAPCSKNCVNRNQVCYLCPMQCAESNNCKRVCEPTCRNQTCEYLLSDSVPVCTKGCIGGHAGKQCQDYCPPGCKTCDQDTANCESCLEGREGQYCSITTLSPQGTVRTPSNSTIRYAEENCKDGNNCSDHCGDCNGLTTDSTQYPLTSTSSVTTKKPDSGNEFAAGAAGAGAGAGAVIVMVICIASVICMYRKMRSRPGGRDGTTNYSTDGSSFTYTGYTYIDETNLGSCHGTTNVRPMNVPLNDTCNLTQIV